MHITLQPKPGTCPERGPSRSRRLSAAFCCFLRVSAPVLAPASSLLHGRRGRPREPNPDLFRAQGRQAHPTRIRDSDAPSCAWAGEAVFRASPYTRGEAAAPLGSVQGIGSTARAASCAQDYFSGLACPRAAASSALRLGCVRA